MSANSSTKTNHPLDIDPKQTEHQRREDRYREIAAMINRGQRPPADAKAALLDLFQELQRHFVDWPRKLASEVRKTLDLKAIAKANQLSEIEFGSLYVDWMDSREDAQSLRGYMLRRWPNFWQAIDRVWRRFNEVVYSGGGGLGAMLRNRPSNEQLDQLEGVALMLDGWIKLYESVIHRYGLRTTDSPDRPLTDSDRRIVAHCRRKAHKGERIAYHLGLSWDHTRRLLARLVREGWLRNTSDGYRAARRAT